VRRLAVALSLGTLVISLGGWVIYAYYDGQIGRFHLPGGLRPAAADGDQNYLLVGSDSRAGGDAAYQGSGQDFVRGQRSDSLILAHLDRDGTTTLISFPRDTLVTIPAFTDASGRAHPETRNRINSALDAGGPALLVQTVERLSGVRVDHYIQIDLAGFKRMTDAIGGVNVCIRKAPSNFDNLNDDFSGFHGHLGINHLDGTQALAFVRQRHGLPGGDLGRIQRQQQFLGAVFRKASSGDTLFHPDRLLGLANSATASLTTDDGTSIRDLVLLAERLRGNNAARLHFETIPVRELSGTDPGAFRDSGGFWELRGAGSVLMYDQPAMDAFFAPLRAQSQQAPAAPASPSPSPTAGDGKPLTVAPSAVSVTVRNGSGTSGVARQVTQGLAAQGFHVGAYGNADRHDYTGSVVSYPPGSLEAARTVAAAVPGAQLNEDPSVPGVVLIVGSSFTSLAQVPAPGAPPSAASTTPLPTPSTPAPTSSSSLSPPPVTAADPANSCTY
jgi:LCP family protein required for cell wall assembly